MQKFMMSVTLVLLYLNPWLDGLAQPSWLVNRTVHPAPWPMVSLTSLDLVEGFLERL